MLSTEEDDPGVRGQVSQPTLFRYHTLYRHYLEKSIVWVTTRWIGFLIGLIIFSARVLIAQGWYISAYALAIYLLNLFIGFLTPQQDQETQSYILPVSDPGDEFRPFQRKLPEFEFWQRGTHALLIALATTVTRLLDLPVFWPILLIYFIILFVLTMRAQIQDMIRHRYLPFSARKTKYADVNRSPVRRSD